jgi:F-type H+-transporting ATPase subunit b
MVIQWMNFGVLLWLLKKLLFGPVTRLLEKRASDVRKLKDDSEEDRRKAGESAREAESVLSKARKDSLDMVASSRFEGFRQKDKIIARAREEANGLIRKARSETELEVEQARQGLRKETAKLAVQVAEKILRRNINQEDQEKMAGRFIDEIGKK